MSSQGTEQTRQPDNPFDSERFREEFERTLDKKFQPILEMKPTIIKHDRALERVNGALWVFGGLWGLVVLAIAKLFLRS